MTTRRRAAIVIVAVVAVTSLAGCSGRIKAHLGFGHRPPAAGTTTIRAAGIPFKAIVRGPSEAKAKLVVLFLHGGSYTSRIWDDRGILDAVAAKGYRAIAVDLPGSGGTPAGPTDGARTKGPMPSEGAVLRDLIDAVGGPARVVVVSPSASGRYSLPYLQQYPDEPLAGFVAVAPVGIAGFHRTPPSRDLPALLIWGANDDVIDFGLSSRLHAQLPGSRVVQIPDASHAAYDDHPKEFEKLLLDFLRSLAG